MNSCIVVRPSLGQSVVHDRDGAFPSILPVPHKGDFVVTSGTAKVSTLLHTFFVIISASSSAGFNCAYVLGFFPALFADLRRMSVRASSIATIKRVLSQDRSV